MRKVAVDGESLFSTVFVTDVMRINQTDEALRERDGALARDVGELEGQHEKLR